MMKNKYYFFNSDNLSKADNVAIRQGKVQKTVTNASWLDQYSRTQDTDIPDWEHRVTIMYPNVEYDEKNKIYKIWYHAFYKDSPIDCYRWTENLIDKNNKNNVELGNFINTAGGVIYDGRDALCYMESTDGINWVRPELGLFYYKTRSGEIIGTNIVYVGMHGLGVKRNERQGEPAYLMAGRTWEADSLDGAGEPVGVAISYSEDGIHWEEPITVKTAFDCASDILYIRADTQNQLMWSSELERYVIITRGYTKKEPCVRVVAYMESTDELRSIRDLLKEKREGGGNYWNRTARYWSRPEIVLDRDVKVSAQPYSMPVAHLSNGCYVGIVSVANFKDSSETVWNSVHAQLSWSPDAKKWYYIDKGRQFIDNAKEFSLDAGNDYGMIYCAAPVCVGDKTYIFYSATPELHYIRYEDIPTDIRKTVDDSIPAAEKARAVTRTTSLNLAQIMKDAYAGLFSKDGSVTSCLFEVLGDELRISAEVLSGGCLTVEVIGTDGRVIPGYSFEESVAMTESAADKAVCWNGKGLDALVGRSVYFKVKLKDSCVYTISGDISKS